MSLSRTALNTLIAGAFAVSLAGASHSFAADDMGKEKCYGVVKAGKNDCANVGKTHSCAGQATMNGNGGDFVTLPKGVCAKLVGSSMKPTSMEGMMPETTDHMNK